MTWYDQASKLKILLRKVRQEKSDVFYPFFEQLTCGHDAETPGYISLITGLWWIDRAIAPLAEDYLY